MACLHLSRAHHGQQDCLGCHMPGPGRGQEGRGKPQGPGALAGAGQILPRVTRGPELKWGRWHLLEAGTTELWLMIGLPACICV